LPQTAVKTVFCIFLYFALASSAPKHIAMTVADWLCSLQQIYLSMENKDANSIDILEGDLIHISIHIKASVLIIHLESQLTDEAVPTWLV
jgi:hypothetical protein